MPESYSVGAPTRLDIRFDPAASREFSLRAEESMVESLMKFFINLYHINALQQSITKNLASSKTEITLIIAEMKMDAEWRLE